eukprot:SAG11_NODE_325_length_10712_cov_15.479883_2_plen_103_part_00
MPQALTEPPDLTPGVSNACDEIIDGLFLGDSDAARSAAQCGGFLAPGVTHIGESWTGGSGSIAAVLNCGGARKLVEHNLADEIDFSVPCARVAARLDFCSPY